MPELFVAGRWQDAADGSTREIHCPADGSLVATVSEGGAEDATAAVSLIDRFMAEIEMLEDVMRPKTLAGGAAHD